MNESNQNTLKYYLSPKDSSKKTLVLDLDETLVHSQFVPFSTKSDLVLKIDLENQIHDIHVMVRPGVNEFLKKMGKLYEIVIFTASVSKYADPLLDIIDKSHSCSHRLFREHCSMVGITYIKDLKKLGRDLKDIIIVDNSPLSYSFNSENGIPILTWFDDKNDKELYNLIPILEFLSGVYDVREYIKQIVINDSISYDNAINVIENYSNQKHDDSNKKYIKEIVYNKKKYKYLDTKNGKENDKNRANCISNENNKIILNNTTGKKDSKNFVNITISNNEINNYLYFSPIYNINNTTTSIYPSNDIYDNDIQVKINPKIFQSKDNYISHTRTNRTKSKELLNKINNNTKKNKVKNKSNDFKKISHIKNNNNKKNYKERVNTAGNKSISYCINISNNSNNNSKSKKYKDNNCNLSPNIIDLKTLVPPKKSNIIKDYQLPKTPEIEEILYPFNERIINNINNKKTINNINKDMYQSRRGNSDDKKNNRYLFSSNLNKCNNDIRQNNLINHEKHKSLNCYIPYTFEHNIINSLKKSNNLNNCIFYEPISSQTCKNSSHSNHKYIRSRKKSKTNTITTNNLSLNSMNKTYITMNDSINKGKNINNKSKISINHKKNLSNQFKIIDISEFDKTNKIKKSIKYDLAIQTGNTINYNFQRKLGQNRSINIDNSYNRSLKNYRGLYGSRFRTIHNSSLNRTNQIINHKKLFNNSIFKNNMKKSITSNKELSNYDTFISHKKTLSYSGEINSYKLIKRTNTSSLPKYKHHKNIKDNRFNHKEVYINQTNMNNDSKYKNIIKNSKREVNEIMNKKGNNKIIKIKEIKFTKISPNTSNKNKININDNNNMANLGKNNNSYFNNFKKSVKMNGNKN